MYQRIQKQGNIAAEADSRLAVRSLADKKEKLTAQEPTIVQHE